MFLILNFLLNAGQHILKLLSCVVCCYVYLMIEYFIPPIWRLDLDTRKLHDMITNYLFKLY